jgi:hypothetical protein
MRADRGLALRQGRAARSLPALSGRLEARVVLEEVLARAPRYAVDEAAVVRVASDQMRGIASLPLQLG